MFKILSLKINLPKNNIYFYSIRLNEEDDDNRSAGVFALTDGSKIAR